MKRMRMYDLLHVFSLLPERNKSISQVSLHLISHNCAMDILSVRKHRTTSFDSVLLLFCERTRERFWRTLFDINHGFLPIPMGNISKACTNLVKALLLRIPFF